MDREDPMDDQRPMTAGEGALYLSILPWVAHACTLSGAG
jgi:hypothetical protein